MADYLIRQGYLPIVFRDLSRSEYLKMVSDAQDGHVEPLCRAVVDTTNEMFFVMTTRPV